ncbi:MAG: sterol desaturase family protein, partial [Pseudomonadota bacterium]
MTPVPGDPAMSAAAFIAAYEPAIRLGAFSSVFAVMALWEIFAPRRRLSVLKARRWAANLGIVVFNSVLLRFLFPVAGVGMAAFSAEQGWGI